jgi:hypothetical protein
MNELIAKKVEFVTKLEQENKEVKEQIIKIQMEIEHNSVKKN